MSADNPVPSNDQNVEQADEEQPQIEMNDIQIETNNDITNNDTNQVERVEEEVNENNMDLAEQEGELVAEEMPPVEAAVAEELVEENRPAERGIQDRLNHIFRYINRLIPNFNGHQQDEDEEDDDDYDLDLDDEDEEDDDDDEEEDTEGTDENDQYDQDTMPEAINYDLALPSGHTYLGENFERVNAPKSVVEQNDEIQIPLMSFPGSEHLFWQRANNSNNLQLLPGQIMPLYFHSPLQTNLIKKRMREQDPTIGFALTSNFYKKLMENTNSPDLDETTRLGILAEIMEARDESSQSENSQSMMQGYDGLVIKVRGRERFRIMSVRREITGNLIANVKILPDIVMNKNPLLITKQKNSNFFLESYLCKNDAKNFNINTNQIICSHAKAETLNTMMPLPAWVYRKYDCDYTIYLIIKELSETFRRKLTFKTASSSGASGANDNEIDYKDPLFFSNWLLNNFPFSDQMRINCLKFNCVNQRLIYMHSLLKSFTNINCSNCGNELCASSDVFSLSSQGFMNPFLNPGGVVHETLTVYKLKNFRLSKAPPSTQHSWFPGYGWQICTCRNCNNHIGWKFTATKPDLKPEKFWGLTRKSIKHTYNQSRNENNDGDDEESARDTSRPNPELNESRQQID